MRHACWKAKYIGAMLVNLSASRKLSSVPIRTYEELVDIMDMTCLG